MEPQFDVLGTFANNSQVMVDGPSGTGKAVLALEKARRARSWYAWERPVRSNAS